MIFYFSATGNSLWVARELAREFGGTQVSVAEALRAGRTTYRLGAAERVFLVFPVHAWGPAVLAERFIGRLTLEGYDGQEVYLVCVCGDDCGRADRLARRALARRGIALTGAFSIQMPNTYILLPGFDVDADAVAAASANIATHGFHGLRRGGSAKSSGACGRGGPPPRCTSGAPRRG